MYPGTDKTQISYTITSPSATPPLHYIPAIITRPSLAIAAHTFISTPLSRMASPVVTNMFQIPADPPMFFSIFGLQSVDPWTARPCGCVRVCVRARACFCVCMCVCVGVVMLPWRVPCSPEKGFLKKRGMSARCTSVGVMLGVGVGECVRVCAL